MDQRHLEKSIIATLVYFNIFDYPLTLSELWKWFYWPSHSLIDRSLLITPTVLADLIDHSSSLSRYVRRVKGFYFLKNQENQISKRLERYYLADQKYCRASRFVKLIKFFPGVKMVAVCNSLAYNNAHQKSDIDLFIITQKNRVWTTRFFTTALAKFLRLRPSQKNTENKICLSFYLDESSLNLEKIKIKPEDIYLTFWICQLTPLFDIEKTYHNFIQSNHWIKEYLPNVLEKKPVNSRNLKLGIISKIVRFCLKIICLESLGDYLEKLLRSFQYKIMPPDLKEAAVQKEGVILNDQMIKLHGADERREKYYQLWQDQLNQLNDFPARNGLRSKVCSPRFHFGEAGVARLNIK